MLLNFPGGRKIMRMLPGFSTYLQEEPVAEITKIQQCNQIQTDPSFNDRYTINKQLPTIPASE